MSILPPFLKKGDTVLLIATARKVSREEMAFALLTLESWGLKVEEGKNLYQSHNQFAGTDAQRATDLQWALSHSNAKAVFFARGGYGTIRIIDQVDFNAFKSAPKWLVGYSDITALHGHLHNLGYCSIHGTMPLNFSVNELATASLKKLLFGEQMVYPLGKHPLNREGVAEAELIGGNLSLLYALSGSPSEMNFDGKILFIEDLDEYLYHIDRMMMQLKRAGKLKNLAGLVVGGMSGMRDNQVPFGKPAEEIIRENVAEYKFPVCFDFPAGHIDLNLAFCHGRRARLDIGNSAVTFNYI